MSYRDIYSAFGLSPAAWGCASGAIELPSPTLACPFPSPGFPPALIPIWLRPNGLEYFGYWRHFFTARHTSIVSCSAESGFQVIEVARTVEQFFTRVCITRLSVAGGPTASLRHFAAAVGVDLGRCDAISIQVGDDPRGLLYLPPFAEDPPFELAQYEPARYRGDFPLPDRPMDREYLRTISGLELTDEERRHLATRPDAPAWLRSDDGPRTFDALLAEGDLQGAWMTLQSPGWPVQRAAAALDRLARRSNDPALQALAEAWIAEPRQIIAY